MAETEKGFRIQTGFLTGNLGGLAEYADQYAAAVRAAIQDAYPDAIVDVRYEDGEGVVPCYLKTLACDLDGVVRAETAHDCEEIQKHVDQILRTVWSDPESWVPGAQGGAADLDPTLPWRWQDVGTDRVRAEARYGYRKLAVWYDEQFETSIPPCWCYEITRPPFGTEDGGSGYADSAAAMIAAEQSAGVR